jgi:hypothetical protein
VSNVDVADKVVSVAVAVMALAAVTGMCPIYKVIGVSTKPKAGA